MPEVFGHLGWRQAKRTLPSRAGAVPIKQDAWALQSSLISRLVYVIVALYAVTFATLSVLDHNSFNTHAFDLGNMDQAVWNTRHGRWFEFTNWEGGTTRLAAHFEPILILVAQLYRIHSGPTTLLVFQSVVMSLGALPAFWLARDKLRSDFAGVVFASAYLLSPALEAANLHDFHVVSLASSLLLFAFYFVHRRRYAIFFLFAVLAMGTKEQVPVTVALMGGYVALVDKRRYWGGAMAGLAILWFIIAFFVIIPHFNPAGASPYIGRYDQLGSSPKEIVAALFSRPTDVLANLNQPGKGSYFLQVFSPVAFLSFLSPLTVVFALPDLALNMLSDFPAMYGFEAHYGAVIAPFIIISGIYGAAFAVRLYERFIPRGGMVLLHGLSLAALIFSLIGYYRVVFLPLSDHVPSISDHDRLAGSFINMIPSDAGVSALSVLNPHVSQRERLYLFPDLRDAEYIFVDATSTPAPIDTPSLEWRIRLLLQAKQREWGVLSAKDGYLLLKRGEANAAIPEEFYSFAYARPSEASRKASASFGESLRLLGYDVHPEGTLHGNDPYAQVTLYWQVTAAPQKGYVIALYLTDEAGHIFDVQTGDPTTTWLPTSRWQQGETMRTNFLRLPLGYRKRATLWLAVIDGKDTKDAKLRLMPSPDGRLTLDSERRLLKLLDLRAD